MPRISNLMYNLFMATYTRKRPSYRQVVEEVLQLSLRDQRRLREKLVKATSVHIVPPAKDAAKLRAAEILAEEIRQIVQAATRGQTLDDAMSQMRGRSWS